MTFAMKRISINGKFLTAGSTAVHTVAEQLIYALDQRLSDDADLATKLDCQLLVPNRPSKQLELNKITTRSVGYFGWQFWEQVELPLHARGSLLVSFCNLAPIATRNAITMIHDAQMFAAPETFRKKESALYQFTLPKIGRRHRRILTVSEFSKQELVRYNIAKEDVISVIHNGGDHALDRPAQSEILDVLGIKPQRYFLGLANPRPQKNLRVVLRAMQSPEMSDFQLVLIGPNGPAAFAEYGLDVPKNTIFAGYVNDGQLRSLMEAALGFVCPSILEGFGLPPLEAMFYGTPAVCAPESSLPEVCGDAALYADAQDPSAWVAAMHRLRSESPEERAARSEQSQRHARTKTWQAAGEKLATILCAELDSIRIDSSTSKGRG